MCFKVLVVYCNRSSLFNNWHGCSHCDTYLQEISICFFLLFATNFYTAEHISGVTVFFCILCTGQNYLTKTVINCWGDVKGIVNVMCLIWCDVKHKMRNMVWTKGTSALDGEFQSASEVDFYIDKVSISDITHLSCNFCDCPFDSAHSFARTFSYLCKSWKNEIFK